jgi:hypothetical protein
MAIQPNPASHPAIAIPTVSTQTPTISPEACLSVITLLHGSRQSAPNAPKQAHSKEPQIKQEKARKTTRVKKFKSIVLKRSHARRH